MAVAERKNLGGKNNQNIKICIFEIYVNICDLCVFPCVNKR